MKRSIHHIPQDLALVYTVYRMIFTSKEGKPREIGGISVSFESSGLCIFLKSKPECLKLAPFLPQNFAGNCLLFLWAKLNCKLVSVNHETEHPETLGCRKEHGEWAPIENGNWISREIQQLYDDKKPRKAHRSSGVESLLPNAL